MVRIIKISALVLGIIHHFGLLAQCEEPSEVILFNSSDEFTISSIISEESGFSLCGSLGQDSEADYVFYNFLDLTTPVEAYRISSDLNDTGFPLQHTKLTNGNYVLAGASQVGGQRHLKIVCFDSDNIFWQKRLEGNFESPRAILALEDGSVLVVGTSETQSNGSSDAFAIRLDEDGGIVWKKGFGGTDNEHFYDAIDSFDGSSLIVGNNATFSGVHRPVLTTVDDAGNIIDYSVYTGSGAALFACVTKWNGLYFAGGYVQSGNRDGIITALDANHEVVWSRRIAISGYSNVNVSGINIDGNGSLFVSAQGEGADSRLHTLLLNPSDGSLLASYTTTQDILPMDVYVIGGYHLKTFSEGSLTVSNFNESGGFLLVKSNECFADSECLEEIEVFLEDYSLTRLDFPPGERILQDVFDVSEFTVSSLAFPEVVPCEIICSGSLSLSDMNTCQDVSIEYSFDFSDQAETIQSFLWQFENGESSDLENPTITYDAAGEYGYSLLITTEDGCTYSAQGVTEVNAEMPLPEIQTEIRLCEDEPYTFSADNYPEWTITNAQGEVIDEFQFNTQGTYNFTFTSGCTSELVTFTVEQIFIDSFVNTQDASLCVGDEFILEIENWESIEGGVTTEILDGLGNSFSYSGTPLEFIYPDEGLYTISVTIASNLCVVEGTIEVEASLPPESFVENTFDICSGETINLDFSNLPFDVFDQNGESLLSTEILSGGTYVFTGENSCASFEEVIVVNETIIDPASTSLVQFLCPGQGTVNIGFNTLDYSYEWASGSILPSIEVDAPGEYEVLVTDPGTDCSTSFVFQVEVLAPSPSVIFEPSRIELCEEGQKQINFPSQFGPYTFSDSLVGLTYEATGSEILNFTYSDGCYTYRDSVKISVESCLCPVWIPNAFTPDGDGLNDAFKPILDCDIYDYEMSIFNRWGEKIFTSKDISLPWRGESPNSGYYSESAVFIYFIYFNQKLDGLKVPVELKGSVNLIR